MNNHLKSAAYALSSVLFMAPEAAWAEPHPGKVLHDQSNCMRCHAAKPYNPEKTTSYDKLVKSVQFCNNNLKLGLWEEEVEQIADYLNQTYYHHPK